MSNTAIKGPAKTLDFNCLLGNASRSQNRTESEEPWKRLEKTLEHEIYSAQEKFAYRAIDYFRWLLAGYNLEKHAVWISGGMGSKFLCCGARMPSGYLERGGKISDFMVNPYPKQISELKMVNDCIARLQEIDQILRSRSDWPESIVDVEIYMHSTPTKH